MKCRSIGLLLGLSLLMCIPALAGDYVVQVGPPTGPDDTGLIQGALNECVNSHPEGCTVQLDAGTYMIQQLFAEDFHGTLRGKGIDVTILQALPDLQVNQDRPFCVNPPSLENKYPMLILFFGGHITVSDMSINVPQSNPTTGWYEGEGQTDLDRGLWGILEFMGGSVMNVVVQRVAFEGVYDENQSGFYGYNATAISMDAYPHFLLPFPGRLSGTFRVFACRFNTIEEGVFAALLRNARVSIGGSPSQANIVQNSMIAASLVDLDSSVVDFSCNDVSIVGPAAWAGFLALQGLSVPIEAPSSFSARHNRIQATGGYEDGIWLVDYGTVFGEGKTADFVISSNNITIEPSQGIPAYAGIQTDFTEGSIISNNRIVGSALFGVALEGDTQAMVKADNVQQVVADVAPIGLMNNTWFVPDLILPTTDSIVVGFGNKTNVYDEGENNTLVGVNNMQGKPPGTALRDAMKRKMEILKAMGKP